MLLGIYMCRPYTGEYNTFASVPNGPWNNDVNLVIGYKLGKISLGKLSSVKNFGFLTIIYELLLTEKEVIIEESWPRSWVQTERKRQTRTILFV